MSRIVMSRIVMSRIVVLASGGGSNLQALLDAGLPVVAVVSDKPDAFALARARNAGLPTEVIERVAGEARADFDRRLADAVARHLPNWVVLAGFMRLLTMTFLAEFPGRVVNLHPALPGELPGTHAIERAFAESRTGHRTRTGVMVHLVPDEGVDNGPVLATTTVRIEPDDTLDSLSARVHETEHLLLVQVMRKLCGKETARV